MRNLKAYLTLATAAASILLTSSAFADSITFTLSNATQAIVPGQTVTFYGTVAAPLTNSGDIYINSDAPNVADADSTITIDDGDFLYVPYPLSPGAFYTGALFTITDHGSVVESYSGSFAAYGGGDANANDLLGTVTFGSPAAPTVTPEPSSLLLLGTGVVGLAAAGKRRMFA